MITVFTPAYNRAYTLPRLYGSLCNQTCHDFEWIVADDGSNDNTFELVREWQGKYHGFEITYIRTRNGGKHRQINRGVRIAKGDAFFIVDSDDDLPDDAIEFLSESFEKIKDDNEFAGISGLCSYRNANKIVGQTPAFKNYIECTNFERSQYGLEGDKSEVYKTELLKKYPFPEYPGENFLTEGIVWDRLAYEGYKLRWFNKVTYNCDYLDDGLTKAGIDNFIKNPAGWGRYITDEMKYGRLSDKGLTMNPVCFYVYEKDNHSDEEMCRFLGNDKHIVEQIMEKLISIKDKVNQLSDGGSISLAGYGTYGKIAKKIFDCVGIRISFVIDKNYRSIHDVKAYPVEDFPEVDTVIITMKNIPYEYSDYLMENNKINRVYDINKIMEV